jgi:four helix bundle protein
MHDFRKLDVWRKAHAMALNTHKLVGRMRGRDTISLRAQMLRAAMSVPANIVEGRAQTTDNQFARFLKIALGSAIELEYHLVLASDIKAIAAADFQTTISEITDIKKMLTGLIKRLESKTAPAKSRAGADSI